MGKLMKNNMKIKSSIKILSAFIVTIGLLLSIFLKPIIYIKYLMILMCVICTIIALFEIKPNNNTLSGSLIKKITSIALPILLIVIILATYK